MKKTFSKTSQMKQMRLPAKKEIVFAFTVFTAICSCGREEKPPMSESDLLAIKMDSARAHDTLLLRLQKENQNNK